ncbi:hypothetical protein E2C01_072672 [Portunus trituberculatus]|uniref:Uncharacterized protein n=1 Tax=Portunus trituberculatus TaxID=210409 RepID=A0A5B7I0N0_PORTR|nr:hypothetical protein [Portunus trituberculatus]
MDLPALPGKFVAKLGCRAAEEGTGHDGASVVVALPLAYSCPSVVPVSGDNISSEINVDKGLRSVVTRIPSPH